MAGNQGVKEEAGGVLFFIRPNASLKTRQQIKAENLHQPD
jgi:hypothetical protein